MSWGYIVDLKLTLPSAAWKALRKRRACDVCIAPGWSKLADKRLEARFADGWGERATFDTMLRDKAYRGADTIRRLEETSSTATIRVCVLCDKSTLDWAYPLVALLHAARDARAMGTLRIVNDGTAPGEDGVVLTLAKGKLKATRAFDREAICEEVFAELRSARPASPKSDYARPGLAELRGSLHVAYRASPKPQTVDIHIESAKPSLVALALINLLRMCEALSEGFGGGAEFAPWTSSAQVVRGPTGVAEPGARGPTYDWTIEAVALSPLVMRSLVERLALLGKGITATRMSIVGALPPDATAMSVDDACVQRWLDDPSARPGRWGDVGFEIVGNPPTTSIEVELAQPRGKNLERRFRRLLSHWSASVALCTSAEGSGKGEVRLSNVVARKSALVATLRACDVHGQPAFDALINGLAYFHHEAARIRRVTLR
jgi:hypothetical protein